MRDQNSDDSDHEGFVANKIKIDQQKTKHQEKEHRILKQFQPHYIPKEGILRKEPPEAILPFKNIPNMPKSYPHKKVIPNIGDLLSAKEFYCNTKLYSLVYKRFREAFGSEGRTTFCTSNENQVKLNCCQQNSSQNFRLLKDWDSNCFDKEPYCQNCLIFDSHFEGGNLLSAFKSKKQQNTYILFMQNDTNTYGYNQWFYFSVRNMKINTKYTFRISNFKKKYSFFQDGVLPLAFSLKKAQKQGNGWYRDGTDVTYLPSEYQEKDCRPYYTLEFSLDFQYDDDYVTLSPYAPYSYSKLISTLHRLEEIATENELSWKLRSISRTLSFNQVPYIILSNKKIKKSEKKKILILARQHSGETWSSFLVQSIMTSLVEQKLTESRWLLDNYDFHIIPMVNVDGVIYGNFRCDLAGYDLNRAWKNPLEQIHPQIFHIKREISKISDKYQVEMCLDLHTHSKEYGSFAYCCVDSQQCRELPQLISTCTPLFQFKACTFGISGQKQHTARAAVFGLTNSLNTLTVELSSCGFKLKSRKYPIPFTPSHINNISNAIINGFHGYKMKIEPRPLVDPIQIQTQGGIETLDKEEIVNLFSESCQEEVHPVEGSDSEPEIDQIEIQVKMKTIFPAKFIEQLSSNKDRKFSKARINKIKKLHKSINRGKMETKAEIKRQESSIEKKYEKIDKSVNLLQPKTLDFEREVSPVVKAKRPVNQIQNHFQTKKHSLYTSQRSQKVQPQRPTKPLNLVEFSLKKLPIAAPQKITQQNYHVLLDEGLPMFAAHGYVRREENRFDKTFSTYEAMVRPRARVHSKKIGVMREDSRLQQELPFLCIMSQTKKQNQMEKMKERQESRFPEKKSDKKYQQSVFTPQFRLQETPILKIHNRPKQGEVISKVGSDQFARYAEGAFNRKQ